MALYTTPSAQVYISGMLSTPFKITNGTPQGCPLSPLIFNLLIIYYYLFTDNIILMLTNVESSIALVHQALQLFNKVSYYTVNETNLYILDLGISNTTKQGLSQRFPYTWKEKRISYLGITLTPSISTS